MTNATSIKAEAVVTHEQRVDTYIEQGPIVRKYLGWNRQNEPLTVGRVVTTYRQRVIGGKPSSVRIEQRVYARAELKDGSPSTVETAIKADSYTPELRELLEQIAGENAPVALA